MMEWQGAARNLAWPGWSCQGPGECQPWRMLATPWHTCVDGKSPIWVCKAVWKPQEIPNKPLFLSLCGLEGGELCLALHEPGVNTFWGLPLHINRKKLSHSLAGESCLRGFSFVLVRGWRCQCLHETEKMAAHGHLHNAGLRLQR